MKKSFILPLLGVALFVGQAAAAICQYNSKNMFCQWDTGCYEVSTDYSGIASGTNACAVGSCTCAALIENCEKFGTVYSGVTGLTADNGYGDGVRCANNGGKFEGGNDPNRTAEGCCLWAETETKCWTIWSNDPDGAATKVEQCKSGVNKFWNGACPTTSEGACPTGTPAYDGSANDCGNHYCKWPEGCYKITPDPAEGITTCAAAISNCDSYGEHFTNSTCSGGQVLPSSNSGSYPSSTSGPPNPPDWMSIKQISMSALDNVVKAMQNGVNIQVVSNAKIQIFDLKGNMVRSLNLSQGSYNIGMSDLSRGTYIVKATGASWKQTITVPVK